MTQNDDDAFGEFLSCVADMTASLQSSAPSEAALSSTEADLHIPDSCDNGPSPAKQKQSGDNVLWMKYICLELLLDRDQTGSPSQIYDLLMASPTP